ncbi:MAG TPA: Gfo/Idh/MocA family oxidoreductase [Oligoflexia bacterium]|nr:Gfo/Idh/MocA family oxidoreductase [Oligoflexia bacterium]
MNDRRLRIGVVGRGFGKAVHVPAFAADPRCEVVFNCSNDWKSQFDLHDFDAISIATPADIQPEITLAALERGKHVFCEKPLATDLTTARRLLESAKQAKVAHMIDFEFQEIPAWIEAKRLIRNEELGAIRHVSVQWNIEIYAIRHGLKDSWKIRSEQGGGALNAFGSHAFYNIEWLLGPITSVAATLHPTSDDEYVSANLTLKHGAPVALQLSTHAFLGNGHRITVYGENGTLVLNNQSNDYIRGFELWSAGRTDSALRQVLVPELDATNPALSVKDGRVWAVHQLARRFIDWALMGAPQTPNFENAYRVQVLIDAAKRSSINRNQEIGIES